jgi:hypothetical protein
MVLHGEFVVEETLVTKKKIFVEETFGVSLGCIKEASFLPNVNYYSSSIVF